ncbi:protease with a role in cell division [Modestobacter italicus]|uniref:Protease with a role in cell division n=1 Tax=Modestobacter italicus (strain DSM 44449 / CECT 9708 / BC 501) TaxID=2732864 RepID=I4EUG7_MODI5|nr:M23 family metallopeptidase [Modestobacter marinus]CCH87030.1 protease with a role in cell division [Modestobacter marinus]
MIPTVAIAGLLVGGGAPSALAAPNVAGQDQPGRDALTAEIERINQRLATTEEELQRATVEAEATADASRAAQAELAAAESAAAAATAELEAAQAAASQAQDDVATLGREAFMGSAPLGETVVLLDAAGPEEVLQRAATMDLLGEDRAARLEASEAVRQRQEDADRAARDAVAERDAAVRAAADADAAAQAQLAASQQAYDAAAAEKAGLEQQLKDAETRLLAARGATDPNATWEQQQRTRLAQASAGAGALVNGRVTSCYGSRWGTNHNGIDIAAPIGTPIFAPESGVVLQAGPANGFGLAVYLQHPDGTITVYGHINQYFVTAGQTVTAGQQIAEVGNKGQVTGPHLHIETHTGGLYQNRVDPAPWLAARGISLGC